MSTQIITITNGNNIILPLIQKHAVGIYHRMETHSYDIKKVVIKTRFKLQ